MDRDRSTKRQVTASAFAQCGEVDPDPYVWRVSDIPYYFGSGLNGSGGCDTNCARWKIHIASAVNAWNLNMWELDFPLNIYRAGSPNLPDGVAPAFGIVFNLEDGLGTYPDCFAQGLASLQLATPCGGNTGPGRYRAFTTVAFTPPAGSGLATIQKACIQISHPFQLRRKSSAKALFLG